MILKAALLFWKKHSASLRQSGFVINPYCIANKNIDGSQCTIMWHVDDLKLSHKCSVMLDKIIASIRMEYGRKGEMTVRQGKTHDYLGMILAILVPGKFTMNMENYIGEIMKNLPEEFDGTTTMPVTDHLFKTRDNAPKLNEGGGDLFHHLTAQLLFLCKRGRPAIAIHTTVTFLCTRVKGPDHDD